MSATDQNHFSSKDFLCGSHLPIKNFLILIVCLVLKQLHPHSYSIWFFGSVNWSLSEACCYLSLLSNSLALGLDLFLSVTDPWVHYIIRVKLFGIFSRKILALPLWWKWQQSSLLHSDYWFWGRWLLFASLCLSSALSAAVLRSLEQQSILT